MRMGIDPLHTVSARVMLKSMYNYVAKGGSNVLSKSKQPNDWLITLGLRSFCTG